MTSRLKGVHRPNFALLISILILILVGTVLISSASVVLSKQNAGDPNFYFKKHLISLVLGAVLFYISYRIDYSFWKKMAGPMVIVAIILMIAVFIPGIGFKHNGAQRWINLGFMNFAPSEIFKLSLIVYLSAWFDKKGSEVKRFLSSTLPFLMILGIAATLIMAQRDLGTMMVTSVSSAIIFFVAGASMPHVFLMGAVGLGSIATLIATSKYRMARLMIFLNPSLDPNNSGYQINQAMLAIGTGGIFGLGFGQSRQKFNYLPEAASDSIFAVTVEELGFIRGSLIVLLFVNLAIQGYRVAQKAPDVFSRLLATGITTWIAAQAFLNISAMLSIVPLTGVPLPFISMGSTSTVMLMFAVGILLNISKHTQGESRESRSLRGRNWWSYITGFSRH